jgi:DNA-binding MarR family transcriptional regulator
MNQFATSPQTAALEALAALFGGLKQATRHHLQGHHAPAVAPMLLRMLQLCKRHPGITQQGLVQHTGRDKGQVARLVKELLDEGLLTREKHPEDGRSHCLQPTAKGLAAVKRFVVAQANAANMIFGDLSATELSKLTQDLNQLKERLDARLASVD